MFCTQQYYFPARVQYAHASSGRPHPMNTVSPLNSGATWGPPGVGVALYLDDGTAVTLLEWRQTAGVLDPGERLAPMIFEVPLATYSSGELVVTIDDDGTGVGAHNECDEDNNQWVVASNPCSWSHLRSHIFALPENNVLLFHFFLISS